MMNMWMEMLNWRQYLLAFGIVLGFYLTWYKMHELTKPRNAIPAQQYKSETLFAGLFALFGAWIGARVGFIFLHWSYYHIHQNEIFQIWLGGLHWSGAILGGVIFILLFAGIRNRSLLLLLDELFPLWVMSSVFLWMLLDTANMKIQHDLFLSSDQLKPFPHYLLPWIGAGITLLAGASIDLSRFRNPTIQFFAIQFALLFVFSYIFPQNSPGNDGISLEKISSISYFIISFVLVIMTKKRGKQEI